WGLLFFALGQLGLSLAMETVAPQLRAHDFALKMKRLEKLRQRHPDRPLVLMMGSSRTLGGFQATRLDGQPGPDGQPLAAFNFGLVLTGPMRENALWYTLR